MTTDSASSALPRAGFWRRAMSILIDAIVVLVPFQVLAAMLFAATAGKVQMYSGFTSQACDKAAIPQLLNPPPPHDSNFAQICRIKLFNATTGVILTVGRTTKEGSVTKTVNQSYMVDEKGDPIDGIVIDWIAILALLVYLVGMIWKTGKTIGARMVGIRFIDAAQPSGPGIPLPKAITRYLAIEIGLIPALALLAYLKMTTDGSADAIFGDEFFRWFMVTIFVAVVWYVLLIAQIARKRDPIYDRLAGTMVVRESRPGKLPRQAEPRFD